MRLVECVHCGRRFNADVGTSTPRGPLCPPCAEPWKARQKALDALEKERRKVEKARVKRQRSAQRAAGRTEEDASEHPSKGVTQESGQHQSEKKNNQWGLAGFIMGITSIFLYYFGMVPLLGIVFSAIGVGTFEADKHKNRWMGITGLILSIVYMLMNLRAWGHLD